ncbi:MAG: hypothetical protein K2Z81_17380, partial [Cyanobacteria bacterium]|nr:hypothetical protein [Cyanobacteriota bacterium]
MEGQALSSTTQPNICGPLESGENLSQHDSQENQVCLLSVLNNRDLLTGGAGRTATEPLVLDFEPSILDGPARIATAGGARPTVTETNQPEELNFAPDSAEMVAFVSSDRRGERHGGDRHHHHRNRRPDAKTELNKDLPPESSLRNGD